MLQQRAPQEGVERVEAAQEGAAPEEPVAEEQEGGDGEEARREPQRENSDSSFEELTMASTSGEEEEEEGAAARQVSAGENCDNPSAEETVREGIRLVMSNVNGSDPPEGGSGDVENEASSAATESDIGAPGTDGGGT